VNVQAMMGADRGRTRPAPAALANLAILAITAAIILAVAYLVNQPSSPSGVTAVTLRGGAGDPPAVGQPAPDFTAAGVDGTPVTLSSFRGRPVWLTFGASWCQPCRAENHDVQATYEKFKAAGVVVVQVYMAEDAAAVADYTARVGISYVRVPDPDERLASQYGILGIPSHFFIDGSGILRQSRVGSLDPAAMEAAILGIGG